MLAVPFSVVGAVWLMYFLGYNVSIAAWVGMIALMGLDAETGVFMLLFLDLSYDEAKAKGRLRLMADLHEAIVHGAVKRVRPKMMTVTAAIMGLMPIMWSIGHRGRRHEARGRAHGRRARHVVPDGAARLPGDLPALEVEHRGQASGDCRRQRDRCRGVLFSVESKELELRRGRVRVSPLALAFAAVVLTATGWFLATVPPFLPPFQGVRPGDAAAADEIRLAQYQRWFAHMRWMVALLALLLVIVTIELGFVPAETLVPQLLTIAIVPLSNVLYSAIDRRRLLARRSLLFFQLSVDLGLLIVLLHLSGGIDSPLYLLPVFNVLLAGIVLTRRQCFVLAWAGGLVCAAGVGAEWARFIPHFTLMSHGGQAAAHGGHGVTYVAARAALQLGLMLLTAHFVSRLAGQTWTYERGLAVAAEEARAGRELLERALENTAVGVRVVDEALDPLLVNEQWRRFFGAGTVEEEAACARRRRSARRCD